jgi:hypothetical protein
MPKIFSQEERNMVFQLANQGLTHAEIARRMSEIYPRSWNSPSAYKSVGRLLKESDLQPFESQELPKKTLDEMTREERFNFINDKLKQTPRYRMVFSAFNDNEKAVFVDEYLSIIRSVDSLTEPEEQSLFAGILELILAFQALNLKKREESLYQRSLDGQISENSPQFRRTLDDRFQREYDQHMKMYQKFMEQLKMSREQRLKEVQTERLTLVDLAEELSSKTSQADAAAEIERLSKLKDSQLKDMLDRGYIHGYFED